MTEDLLTLARAVAGRASGGEEIEAYVSRTRETDVSVLDAEVESLTVAERGGIGIRVLNGGRQGFAWAGSLDVEVIDRALDEARDNATFATPDDCQGVPTPEDAAGPVAALDLWRDELEAVSTADKVALTLELEAATRSADPRVRAVESAQYGDALIEMAIANSAGVSASTRRTICSCSAVALAGDGDTTQSAYGFSAGRSFEELDVTEAASDAATRAVRLLGATPASSRSLPVVLDPLVTRSLLALLGAALNGEAVLKGRSMFVGRAGEAVAAPGITLVDDPTMPVAFGAATHDGEGVPTRRNELIVAGTLTGFLYDTVTGRRAATGTTGSAVRGGYASTPGVGARALALAPGERSPEAILAGLDDALYVQSVSGLHSGANPVSGDFSVGAVGLMVRGGAFAEPVREVTIASTLPRMLLDVVEVGADLTWLPGAAAGVTLLIGEMTLSGS